MTHDHCTPIADIDIFPIERAAAAAAAAAAAIDNCTPVKITDQ